MDEFIKKSELIVSKLGYQSVIELLIDRLNTDSERTCIIDCSLDRKWTKQQVLDSGLNIAYHLSHVLGIKKGDVVCVGSNNSDIHGITFIGVLAAGAVYSSFREDFPEYEINNIVTKTKPSLIICTGQIYQIVKRLAKDMPFIKKILLIESQSKSQSKSDTSTVEEIMGITRDSQYPLPIRTELNDLATFVITSGSTGQPKVILRTNANQIAMIECLQHKEMSEMRPTDTQLANGLCHISGQMLFMASINGGAKIVFLRQETELAQTFEAISKYKVTRAILTPPLLNYLAKNYQNFEADYLACFKSVMTGGAPISEAAYNTVTEKLGFINVRNGYGMSETGWAIMVYFNQSKSIPNGLTIGKVCPNVEIKVIDENGRSLSANEMGEICIKSGQVTPGYLDNDEESHNLFTADGFVKSGDIGFYDDNDYFYVVGRIKDMIIVSTVNVYPVELEGILMTHPNVQNAAVVGVKHKDFGEVPIAFVTLNKGSTVKEQTLIEYVDTRVNYYKKLRGGLKILDTFPLTSIQKINKPELKKMFVN